VRVHVARVQIPTVQLGEVKPTREQERLEVTKRVEHPGERTNERTSEARSERVGACEPMHASVGANTYHEQP